MTTLSPVQAGNLPAEPNSFVGRERDLAELKMLLGEIRAVTLCGPGGIGKTRLALRLATEIGPGFADGAWFVDLGDTVDGDSVARRVAVTLGIQEEAGQPLADTLAAALRQRNLLLILDTCEHLVDACAALVQQLLAGCPRVRLIMTSREPLRVRGETAWRVPPLELPPGPALAAGTDLSRHEAIRLFAERAAAVRPGFSLGPSNAEAVLRLCRTLDGMPLAIELAAARVRALSVEQIAGRLDDRFQLLAGGDRTAPPRQQTLRAAVDWSYELLTEREQVLLRRLSVFSGWNLEMAEQVCADEQIPAAGILDLLAALIDKSLVSLDGEVAGDARYRLLDTIREYAAARLAAAGEEAALRLRHRDYLVTLAEDLSAQIFRTGDPPHAARVVMYQRTRAERGNCEAALAFSLERGDAADGLRLCSALRSAWVVHGNTGHGAAWFDRFFALPGNVDDGLRGLALVRRADLAFHQQDYPAVQSRAEAALATSQPGSGPVRTGALNALALVSLRTGRREQAVARAEEAREAARAACDDWEEGLALSTKAAAIAQLGRLAEAERVFTEALAILRDNNRWGVAQVLYGLGSLARARGDRPAAAARYREALGLYRDFYARPEIARCLTGLAWVALEAGDLPQARSCLVEALQLSRAAGQRLAMARSLEAFAALAARDGSAPLAARLAGAAVALRDWLGHRPAPGAGARQEDLLRRLRGTLGGPATAALLAEGRELSPDEAVALAARGMAGRAAGAAVTGVPRQMAAAEAAGPPSPSAGASVLTARELEIARLIARGLSNRAIAAELVIAPATAARHVANIFTKLGFSSRAQVAAWIAKHPADC
jgi:predicted ATPase/DNA-binding CsgD family transcriptional regulator